MGYSKSDTSTFQRLPVQNNKHLGCNKLNLEQSPHIPYGENLRLEWDWEELSISLWRFEEKAGWEVIWKGILPIWRTSLLELQGQIGFKEKLIDKNPWIEGWFVLERWYREVWGNLTIWFYMPRLFHLFIDILTTGSFHLLCKEDFKGLWPGPWKIFYKSFSAQDKKAVPPCWR